LTRGSMKRFNLAKGIMDGRVKPGHDAM
jgi:hypothetical protein